MVPESNGKPRELTINTSVFPKKAMVKGRSNLKMNNNTDITTILAIMKFLIVTFS